jgi:DinB superfamily
VPDPYDPLDLPFDGYARFPNPIAYERDARPPLADVLALRADRVARVRAFLEELTQEKIESTIEFESESWPFNEAFPVGPCLATVVNEEWHHRTYAERDLDALIARGTG